MIAVHTYPWTKSSWNIIVFTIWCCHFIYRTPRPHSQVNSYPVHIRMVLLIWLRRFTSTSPSINPCHWFLFSLSVTKAAFISSLEESFCSVLPTWLDWWGVPWLSVHSLHTGGTLEYLLQGIPFDMVKTMGRWSSNSFQMYLCQHGHILPRYLQVNPDLASTLHFPLPPLR